MPVSQYLSSTCRLLAAMLASVPKPGEAAMFLYVQLK